MADKFPALCMTPVSFHEDKSLDEDAIRAHLRRLVATGTALFLSSGGCGEAHSLTPKELRKTYDIGVQEGKGKVPVWAALRESRSAAAMYEIAKEAATAGVDVIQMYQLDPGHGMIPNEREQEAYWYELLDNIKQPVAISLHYESKYRASVRFMERLCKRYDQIVGFVLVQAPTAFFYELRAALPDSMKFICSASEFPERAPLGATGYVNVSNSFMPYLVRSLGIAWAAGDLAQVSKVHLTLHRFHKIVHQWAPSTARWAKMAMKVQGLGNGVIRLPYLLPPEEELRKMAEQFSALGINQFEAEAKTYVEKAVR